MKCSAIYMYRKQSVFVNLFILDFSFGQWLYRWLTGDSKKYLKLD